MDYILNKRDHLDIEAIYTMITNLNPIYQSCLEKSNRTFSRNLDIVAMIHEGEDTIYNRFLTSEKKALSIISYLNRITTTIFQLKNENNRNVSIIPYLRVQQELWEKLYLKSSESYQPMFILDLKETFLMSYFIENSHLSEKEKIEMQSSKMLEFKLFACYLIKNHMQAIPLENINDNLSFYFNIPPNSDLLRGDNKEVEVGYYFAALSSLDETLYYLEWLINPEEIENIIEKSFITIETNIFLTSVDSIYEFLNELKTRLLKIKSQEEMQYIKRLISKIEKDVTIYKSTQTNLEYSRKCNKTNL